MFTEFLSSSTSLAPTNTEGVWQLEHDRHPYRNRPDALVIPRGSLGHLHSAMIGGGAAESSAASHVGAGAAVIHQREIVQWENEYNAWGVFVGEIDLLLSQMQYGADAVQEDSVLHVTQICRLLSAMLEQDVDMVLQAVPQLKEITPLLHQVIHR